MTRDAPPDFLRRQRGFTLVEVGVALSVAAVGMLSVNALVDSYQEDQKAVLAAQQLSTFGLATQSYIKDNMSTVLAGATATIPFVVPAASLTPYAAGVQNKNAYGQTMCALVLQPAAGTLQALVVTTGGTTVNNLDLGQVASTVGAAGGGIYSTATTTLRGTAGGWSLPVGNYANANKSCADGATAGTIPLTAGHSVMALWFANSAEMSAVVYRDAVPGHPELNTMNTPLIFSATAVQTSGNACSPTGAVARDAAGALLSCQGTWKTAGGSAFWMDPVGTFASLPAGDPVGAVRMTTDTRRAFMWTGGAWAALAVDQNGNLTVPGTLTAAGGRVITWNQAAEGGVVQLVGANGQSIYMESNNGTFRLINSPWNAEIFKVDQSGNVTTYGGLTMQPNSSISDSGRLHINAAENLYLNPWSGGTTVVGGGGGSGTLSVTGRTTSAGVTSNGYINTQTEDWALVGRNGAGADNAAAQSGVGSAYLNDAYFRSIGKWASQMGAKPRFNLSYQNALYRTSSYVTYDLGRHSFCFVNGIHTGNETTVGYAYAGTNFGDGTYQWYLYVGGNNSHGLYVACWELS